MTELMVTRFNNLTQNQNQRWKQQNNFSGCIYNTPVYIKETIPLMITIYVIEMNNEENKIIGFGKIINKVYTDKKYRIYEEGNYNRYTYKGHHRVDIESINNINNLELTEKTEKTEKQKKQKKQKNRKNRKNRKNKKIRTKII